MFPSRAVGYMRPPTSEEVVKYAARHHLHPTPEDLTELVTPSQPPWRDTPRRGRRTPAVVPTEDAVVVECLLDAGAVITGKTNLEDLALGAGEGSAFGAARNPHNPKYATGGSSSGSAAAVAAGMVDMALGADEGGASASRPPGAGWSA